MNTRNIVVKNKKKLVKLKAEKKSMSQLFDENAKHIPYTLLKVIDKPIDLDLNNIKVNTKVLVTGKSKGKGFAGTMRRWNFSGGPATHGSHIQRSPGSIGAQGYGRVLKGKKMPGRMGGKTITFNTFFMGYNEGSQSLMLKGGIPGSINSTVEVYFKDG